MSLFFSGEFFLPWLSVKESSYFCATSYSVSYYSISRIHWYANDSFTYYTHGDYTLYNINLLLYYKWRQVSSDKWKKSLFFKFVSLWVSHKILTNESMYINRFQKKMIHCCYLLFTRTFRPKISKSNLVYKLFPSCSGIYYNKAFVSRVMSVFSCEWNHLKTRYIPQSQLISYFYCCFCCFHSHNLM